MATEPKPTRQIKTADTIFGIIEVIKQNDGTTLSKIADEMEMANSTIHDHLSTLVNKDYLTKEESEYQIGLIFLDYGEHSRENYEIVSVAEQTLEQLADETGEVVWLHVEEHGYNIAIANALGDHAVITAGRIGKRTHLHTTAGGKSIMAHLSADRVEEILETHGLTQQTKDTITDVETLYSELEEIREKGYSFNGGESVPGVRAVGSPILVNEQPIASVSVAAPKNRMPENRFHEYIPEKVLGATNEIELKMNYQ